MLYMKLKNKNKVCCAFTAKVVIGGCSFFVFISCYIKFVFPVFAIVLLGLVSSV